MGRIFNNQNVPKRGLDGKQVGVFASRTPDRLSRIGIQDVSLLDIKDTILFVKGLDAISGTSGTGYKIKNLIMLLLAPHPLETN